jgi:hypothetical protein
VISVPSTRILEVLAILEAAVLECKKREVATPEVKEALDLMEPYVRPKWLIPKFRHCIDGEQQQDYSTREGRQQMLRVTFPGIRTAVRVLMEVRMDALARKFGVTHDRR